MIICWWTYERYWIIDWYQDALWRFQPRVFHRLSKYIVQTGKGHKGYLKNYWKIEASALYLKNSSGTFCYHKKIPSPFQQVMRLDLWKVSVSCREKRMRSKTTRRLRWLAKKKARRGITTKNTRARHSNSCLGIVGYPYLLRRAVMRKKRQKNEDCFWNVCEKLHEIDVSARYVFNVFKVIPTISVLKFVILIENEISVSKWKINWRRFVCKTDWLVFLAPKNWSQTAWRLFSDPN